MSHAWPAAVVLLAAVLLAGCAGDEPSAPATTSPSSQTPVPTPTPAATPAATPSAPEPSVPEPEPATEEVTAAPYVEPVFEAQDELAQAADPASFADVNPFEYRNPWRT